MARISYPYFVLGQSARRGSFELLATLRSAAGRGLDHLLLWAERVRSRRRLLSLDDRMLQDIGIERATAEREAAMPFWRLEDGDAASRVTTAAFTARPRQLSTSCCG